LQLIDGMSRDGGTSSVPLPLKKASPKVTGSLKSDAMFLSEPNESLYGGVVTVSRQTVVLHSVSIVCYAEALSSLLQRYLSVCPSVRHNLLFHQIDTSYKITKSSPSAPWHTCCQQWLQSAVSTGSEKSA